MSDESGNRLEAMARGILTGGAIGAIASLLGFMDMHRALMLGMVCGILGALTLKKNRKG